MTTEERLKNLEDAVKVIGSSHLKLQDEVIQLGGILNETLNLIKTLKGGE